MTFIDGDRTDYEDTNEPPICSKASYLKPAPSSEWKVYKYLLTALKALNPHVPHVPQDKLPGKFFGAIYDSNPSVKKKGLKSLCW